MGRGVLRVMGRIWDLSSLAALLFGKFSVEELLLSLSGISGLMIFAEGHRSGFGEFLKCLGKVTLVFETGEGCDFPQTQVGSGQKVPAFDHPEIIHVISESQTHFLLEQHRKVRGVDV